MNSERIGFSYAANVATTHGDGHRCGGHGRVLDIDGVRVAARLVGH